MFVFYLRIHLNLGLFKKKTTKLGWEVLLFVQSLPRVFFFLTYLRSHICIYQGY